MRGSILGAVRNSLAFRSGAFYARVVRLVPRQRVSVKPTLPVTLLTFGGKSHLRMLLQCVDSLGNAWPALPRVRVVSDGTLDRTKVLAALAGWPAGAEVIDWRDLVPELRAAGHELLIRFAEREPMGRKFAAVVATAAVGPTLYSDVDILWFRFPERLRDLLGAAGPQLVMSEDCYPSYDADLVPRRLPHLAQPPFFCAGMLFAQGDFMHACALEEWLAHAVERGIGVTEQTILAEADHQLGGRHFSRQEIALFEDDRFSLAPSFLRRSWAARHYVGQVRHLFWRDALALRLGLRGAAAASSG